MLNKLKTLLWFLSKPKYIPQVFQVIKRNKNKALENSATIATKWCLENKVSKEEALLKLGITNSIEKLSDLFQHEYEFAIQAEEKCPLKMGGEGATDFIYQIIKHKKPSNIVETGVAYGWSSLAILLAIRDNEKAKLISSDMPYIKMNNDKYVGCVIPVNLKTKWELQRAADINGIPLALKKFNFNIDLFHYDSDKSYTGRMWSSPIIWKALKKGGLFISDDINDNLAFKNFCDSVNKIPIIVEHKNKYVGVIVK